MGTSAAPNGGHFDGLQPFEPVRTIRPVARPVLVSCEPSVLVWWPIRPHRLVTAHLMCFRGLVFDRAGAADGPFFRPAPPRCFRCMLQSAPAVVATAQKSSRISGVARRGGEGSAQQTKREEAREKTENGRGKKERGQKFKEIPRLVKTRLLGCWQTSPSRPRKLMACKGLEYARIAYRMHGN